MKWSWKIGRIAGIDVFVHWTFLLLVGWILVARIGSGETAASALKAVAFLLAIFACVLLHELGHALMARRYRITTRDITLLPIGGVARLERMPDAPLQELAVALAGPAVNVVIAATLAAGLALSNQLASVHELDLRDGSPVNQLLTINVILVIFNLLPAFPMDGGRVLRAILATRLEYVRATQIAATIGQGMAVIFGVFGFFYQPLLMFIALFVYLGAQAEAHHAEVRSLMRGVPVREAMVTRFKALAESDQLSTAVTEVLSGQQQDFPVTDDDRVVGLLLRADLVKALAETGPATLVGRVMKRELSMASDAEMLEGIFDRMRQTAQAAMPVQRQGKLVGMITLENVGEWMMINNALRRSHSRGSIEDIFRG